MVFYFQKRSLINKYKGPHENSVLLLFPRNSRRKGTLKVNILATRSVKYYYEWLKIFEGDDPATDLRGVGIFGLCQLLFLVSNGLSHNKIEQLYILSNDKVQVDFLFAYLFHIYLLSALELFRYTFLFFLTKFNKP